ncbi:MULTISPECIES: 50S ribosomal protein L22 [Caldisericum]|jgi:large subunit ribosomal protein L22|uniref:Large ribosomal subunit protein uL22 n=1 Tax=Caldisericum exile TaxID=693075 RepID=A0A2J6WDM6_9BACT|nr:MAG: 50S ribosomal protein L22 [Caldisericum exile]
MEAYAVEKHLRLSASKARLVAELIKGKSVREARAILKALPHKAARFIEKALNSAVANGVNNFKMDEDIMYVSDIFIDAEGPLKRVLPRGFGRADIIRRPVSQIKIIVKEKEEV